MGHGSSPSLYSKEAEEIRAAINKASANLKEGEQSPFVLTPRQMAILLINPPKEPHFDRNSENLRQIFNHTDTWQKNVEKITPGHTLVHQLRRVDRYKNAIVGVFFLGGLFLGGRQIYRLISGKYVQEPF